MQNLDRYWFDTIWWGILSAVGGKRTLQAKIYLALRGEPGIGETHTRERLRNAP
jgi:hypothetical protein